MKRQTVLYLPETKVSIQSEIWTGVKQYRQGRHDTGFIVLHVKFYHKKKEDWEDTDHESMIDSRNKILHLEPGIRYAGLSMEIASENGTT